MFSLTIIFVSCSVPVISPPDTILFRRSELRCELLWDEILRRNVHTNGGTSFVHASQTVEQGSNFEIMKIDRFLESGAGQ